MKYSTLLEKIGEKDFDAASTLLTCEADVKNAEKETEILRGKHLAALKENSRLHKIRRELQERRSELTELLKKNLWKALSEVDLGRPDVAEPLFDECSLLRENRSRVKKSITWVESWAWAESAVQALKSEADLRYSEAALEDARACVDLAKAMTHTTALATDAPGIRLDLANTRAARLAKDATRLRNQAVDLETQMIQRRAEKDQKQKELAAELWEEN